MTIIVSGYPKPAKVSAGPASACEPYREIIEAALAKGLTAHRIWQDLCEDYRFSHQYASVKRFVRTVKRRHPEVAAVMEHPPGEEAQVDFFQGPPTLDPGTGKSHIAAALTIAAIQAGHTALYRSAFDLAQDMAEADATGTRKEIIARLCKVDLLVLEDLGMKRLPPTAGEDLLEVFVRRYENGAIILTTNRPMEDWGQVLGDTAAAGAILDRFLHHAEVIRLQGRSYRMHNRKELRSKQTEETLTGKIE